jgi:hypothetical protein
MDWTTPESLTSGKNYAYLGQNCSTIGKGIPPIDKRLRSRPGGNPPPCKGIPN